VLLATKSSLALLKMPNHPRSLPLPFLPTLSSLRSIVADLDHGVLPMSFNKKKIDKKNIVTSLFSLYYN
jgi:hypothetical protein